MTASVFYIPSINMIGMNSLDEALKTASEYGYRNALIVTDGMLSALGMAGQLKEMLSQKGINSVIFDGTHPNPTTENVEAGLSMLRAHRCDCVISLGGGSPHDCAKGIALVAANGGDIRDFEGVDRSRKPQLPMIAINTGFAPIFPDICYHLTHYKPAAADI
ncbi:iron-containing alcohol dehydrogenase, partial [Cronobacter sakazakii]|nr:iron-containing alcohol dehydrogenase [Cronobacter sakazakii]